MKAQVFVLLLLPTVLLAQSGDAWHFQIHTGVGQSQFNILGPSYDFLEQSQQIGFRSKISVARSFNVHDKVYFRTGLGIHHMAQRAQEELRFPDQIDPTCGFCSPTNDIETLTLRNLALFVEVPLLFGTTKQMGKSTLYGELGPTFNVSLYNSFVRKSEPNGIVSIDRISSFTNQFILLPALNLAVGIEKKRNAQSAYRIGLYGEMLLTSTDRAIGDAFPLGYETGLQLSWVLVSAGDH
ncbi:MAG: hypothetical protein AAFW00_03445 [Bacteroidota bacterium]